MFPMKLKDQNNECNIMWINFFISNGKIYINVQNTYNFIISSGDLHYNTLETWETRLLYPII